MELFTVPATLSNPLDPERRLVVDLIVDTGAVYTMLPAPMVQELGLETPREWRVMRSRSGSSRSPATRVARGSALPGHL